MQFFVIGGLLAGQISCSAELSTKRSFTTLGPGNILRVNDILSREPTLSKNCFCTKCFFIILPSSQYDSNNIERGVKHPNYQLPLVLLQGYRNNLSIGTERPLQTVQTQIRCCKIQHLIRVYTVCNTNSNILDT